MAAAAQFSIEVCGQGTHGAAPHLGKGAVLAAAQFVCALHGIVARDLDPLETGVISVGNMRCDGGACNVIPERVTLEGTSR